LRTGSAGGNRPEFIGLAFSQLQRGLVVLDDPRAGTQAEGPEQGRTDEELQERAADQSADDHRGHGIEDFLARLAGIALEIGPLRLLESANESGLPPFLENSRPWTQCREGRWPCGLLRRLKPRRPGPWKHDMRENCKNDVLLTNSRPAHGAELLSPG